MSDEHVEASATDGAPGGMRRLLVDTAVQMLADDGPGAVQARSVARRIGASTTAVYHHFGGMPQLLAAVTEEGFRRLDERLADVPTSDDPIADLARLGLAYREAALANPYLYDLMFGLSAPGGYRPQPKPGVHGAAVRPIAVGEPMGAAYERLVDAAARAIDAGRLTPADPAAVAVQLWAVVHGVVTLELSAMLGSLDAVTQVFVPLAANLLLSLGDEPERLFASAADVFPPGGTRGLGDDRSG